MTPGAQTAAYVVLCVALLVMCLALWLDSHDRGR